MMDEAKQQIADILWERLVKEFNDEAETYDPESYESLLGSIGPVEDREVMRSKWWQFVDGYLFGVDYDEITWMIEREHDGEELATGQIHFGS